MKREIAGSGRGGGHDTPATTRNAILHSVGAIYPAAAWGVYFHKARMDNEVEVGKLALIR